MHQDRRTFVKWRTDTKMTIKKKNFSFFNKTLNNKRVQLYYRQHTTNTSTRERKHPFICRPPMLYLQPSSD